MQWQSRRGPRAVGGHVRHFQTGPHRGLGRSLPPERSPGSETGHHHLFVEFRCDCGWTHLVTCTLATLGSFRQPMGKTLLMSSSIHFIASLGDIRQ